MEFNMVEILGYAAVYYGRNFINNERHRSSACP